MNEYTFIEKIDLGRILSGPECVVYAENEEKAREIASKHIGRDNKNSVIVLQRVVVGVNILNPQERMEMLKRGS